MNHPWFKTHEVSKINLSMGTLKRMQNFTHSALLKKAVLNYIAFRCNDKAEISKYRKIFLKLDSEKKGYLEYDGLRALLKT